jgi:O-succinylbenzoate synthase
MVSPRKLTPITIQDIQLYPIAIPLVEALTTSFGGKPFKAGVIVEIITDKGVHGWGEVSVDTKPGYGYETDKTALHILKDFIVPALMGKTIAEPVHVPALLKYVRGHQHTKAGVESAVWDAIAKTNDMRLIDLFALYMPDGHTSRGKATVGVSIGIQPSFDETLDIITKRLNEGYKRIKLKIKPDWDVELARAIRNQYPDISLMLDANSAYTLADADHLQQLDDFDLLMIEQPLAYTDIYEHAELNNLMRTPICLDESMKSNHDLLIALKLGAIDILNLKPIRVGGYTESIAMYTTCSEYDIPLWIGGMLETGIGRALNVAFASFPAVNLPCDLSATNRYFNPDITEPEFVLNKEDSTLAVPDGYGIGVEIQRERLSEAVKGYDAL